MFALPDSYVWDFWLVDDGDQYHLFFLYASVALQNPDARHHRASVGHAVSPDLRSWERIEDALVRSDAPAFDDLATWTGSVVRADDGTWHMFYTGATLTSLGNVQSVGVATSSDLISWTKSGSNPVLEADSRWYELITDGTWNDQAFRDPFVYQQKDGTWRMLITARSNHGPVDDRGVIGTATSTDLTDWTLEQPLTEPGAGFGQLEVLNTAEIDGQSVLFFSCLRGELSAERRASGSTGGVWAVVADEPGAWDPRDAQQITGDDLYVGRVVEDRSSGQPLFLAFRNSPRSDDWLGGVIDPQPIGIVDGRVVLQPAALMTTAR